MIPELTGNFLSTKFSDSQKDMQMNKQTRAQLEKEVYDLEKQMVETKGNSESIVATDENAKIELEKIHDYITNGIILRSKAHWYEEEEKNSKYFLSLEKQQSQITYQESN